MKGIENPNLKRRLFAEEKDDSSNHPAQAVQLGIDFFLINILSEDFFMFRLGANQNL